MSLVARYIGRDEVVEQFEKIGKPNFSMWCKSALISQYNGSDIDEAIAIIDEEIERNCKRKMGQECFLKIHPRQEANYTLKSEVAYNIVFKSYDNPDYGTVANGTAFNHMLLEKLNAIESRITGMEEEDEDDEEDPNDPAGDKIAGYINGINQILDHPAVSLLIDKFLKPNQPGVRQLAGASELPQEQQQKLLNEALVELFNKGVTLDHFIKLSKMSKEKIQTLIQFI